MNRKGQFSIIAALFVAAILISSVMVTYSTIRYNTSVAQPQIMNAVDETNLALKQVLGFTVGYYGSIMQVTGNSSYAYTESENYLYSGLNNIVDVNPSWDTSFTVNTLSLGTYWFTDSSYSQGSLDVSYNLPGIGVYNISYSISAELSVQVLQSTSKNQVFVTVTQDTGQPDVTLSKSSFKFYQYQDSNLTWGMVSEPEDPVVSSNGTYTLNIPSGINPQSFIIQVQDQRGITVAASSFSHYTGTLDFSGTTASGGNYVNEDNARVDGVSDQGTHSDFQAQQQAPSGTYDTLSEQNTGTQSQSYYPIAYGLQSGTTLISGSLSNLASNGATYMSFQSYPSAYSTTQYATTTLDSSATAFTSGATSLSWSHTTGTESNMILLISVDIYSYSGGTPATVSTVYYGSTQVTSSYSVLCTTSPEVRSYVYYLVAPVVGTNTITVTFSASTPATGGSTTYYNVNQASPIIAGPTNSGSSTGPSVTYTASGSTTKVLFGHVAAAAQTSSTLSLSDSSGQTNRWSKTGSYTHGSTTYNCAARGSDKSVTSGSVGLSWTSTRTVSWTAIAILLQPSWLPTQETCQVVFSGPSNTLNLNSLTWAIDASASISVATTMQLYNYNAGQYPTSGNGYQTVTLTSTNATKTQTVSSNAAYFRDNAGNWQVCITSVASASSSFNVNFNLVRFTSGAAIYSANFEEEWINLNTTTLLHPELCIYGGNVASSSLAVYVWYDEAWQLLSSGLVSGWNNMSISSYLTAGSTTFAIKFVAANGNVANTWQVAATLIRPESNLALFDSLNSPSATVAVELLQNGTMIWLGQNMTVTGQLIPIPPIPVKAIHVNETISGVNEQVPFQIEDWASDYTVPLGLTNNATVFGNMQMIVFLVNTHVSAFTLWWNGSSQAVQTPLAYTDEYFTGDNPNNNFLSNGKLSIQFGSPFTATSTVIDSGTSSTTSFMQVNNQASTYGSGVDYVIYNGVVRDIIHQEAEWSGGVTNCPNFYANIVLTIPANATYFTYQLSLMFLSSTPQRTISELCPITLSSSENQVETENGTSQGNPVVVSGTNTFSQTATWVHHWSEFISGSSGAGIMYTDEFDHALYAFDSIHTPTARGALSASLTTQTISLLPVTLNSVSFQNTYDITWCGAVVTFDNSVLPIYNGVQPGLWVLAELPPSIAVTVGN
jgi:hypothetical protein